MRRAVAQRLEYLPLAVASMRQVVVDDGRWILAHLRPVAGVQRRRAEVVYPPQRVEVGEQVPLRVHHDRGAPTKNVVTHENGTVVESERQVVVAVTGRRHDPDRHAADHYDLGVAQHTAGGAGDLARSGRHRGAEFGRPRLRGLGVIDVVVRHQDQVAPGVHRGQRGPDAGQVPAIGRSRIHQGGRAGADPADEISVGTVKGQLGRVGCQQASDQLIQARHAGQRSDRGHGPAQPWIDRSIPVVRGRRYAGRLSVRRRHFRPAGADESPQSLLERRGTPPKMSPFDDLRIGEGRGDRRQPGETSPDPLDVVVAHP